MTGPGPCSNAHHLVLQDLLQNTETVHYDVGRRTLMFGVTSVGS